MQQMNNVEIDVWKISTEKYTGLVGFASYAARWFLLECISRRGPGRVARTRTYMCEIYTTYAYLRAKFTRTYAAREVRGVVSTYVFLSQIRYIDRCVFCNG
jgi:hypothetical protein